MEETMFSKLYSATKEAIDLMKKPLVERELKRKISRAVDTAKDKKIDAENGLAKLQEDIKNYDLNAYLQHRATIESADKTIAALTEHYKELFGEELQ